MLKLEKKYENVENSYKTFTVTFHKFFLFQMKVIIKVFFFCFGQQSLRAAINS